MGIYQFAGVKRSNLRRYVIALPPLLLSLVLCGCGTHHKAVAVANRADLSQESQIRVAATEYIIRDRLYLPTQFPIFVTLPDVERAALASRLDQYRILPASQCKYRRRTGIRERKTGAEGGLIEAFRVEIKDDEASARVAFATYGEVLYRCKLKKVGGWQVISATAIGYGD